jgi:hypothetical protein
MSAGATIRPRELDLDQRMAAAVARRRPACACPSCQARRLLMASYGIRVIPSPLRRRGRRADRRRFLGRAAMRRRSLRETSIKTTKAPRSPAPHPSLRAVAVLLPPSAARPPHHPARLLMQGDLQVASPVRARSRRSGPCAPESAGRRRRFFTGQGARTQLAPAARTKQVHRIGDPRRPRRGTAPSAYSDEAGRGFQSEAGRCSDVKPATVPI